MRGRRPFLSAARHALHAIGATAAVASAIGGGRRGALGLAWNLRGGRAARRRRACFREDGRRGQAGPSFGAGFVGFRTLSGAAVATQVFHAEAPGGLVATPAPEPRDVIWRNIGFDTNTRARRGAVADCLVVLLLVFYVVPVTLVAMALSETTCATAIHR